MDPQGWVAGSRVGRLIGLTPLPYVQRSPVEPVPDPVSPVKVSLAYKYKMLLELVSPIVLPSEVGPHE